MLKLIPGIAALAFAVTTFTASADAQQVCGKRTDFIHKLDNSYKETTSGIGLVNNGTIIEVLTSKKGSWTILMTRTDGMSCIVASGQAWEKVPQQVASGPAA